MTSVQLYVVCIGFVTAFSWLTGQQACAQLQPSIPTSIDLLADEFDFDIPPGRTLETIIEISRQSGIPVIIDEGLAEDEAPAIKGRYELGPLLRSLFEDQPVEVLALAGGVTIQRGIAPGAVLTSLDTPRTLETPDVEEPLVAPKIHVFGFRQALRSAIDIKQTEPGVSEVILSEDIGRYPELNLAESLQRIPGITITRERGEGAEISLRGLGPEFTRVQIDGVPILINRERDRGFEFSALSSDLFQRVDVRKSYDVTLDEGGIGGTVLLSTAAPFDYEGRVGSLSGALGSNSNSEKLDHRLFGLLSLRHQFGDSEFGALISIAGSNRVSEGQDASTYRYRAAPIPEENLTSLDPELATLFAAGEVSIPRGNRYRVSTEDQERIGATAALQWRTNDAFEVSVKALYGRHDVDRRANNIQTRGQNSFPVDTAFEVDDEVFGPTLITDASVNSSNELEYAVYQDAVIGSENTVTVDEGEFFQIGGEAKWTLSNGTVIDGQLGHSSYEYNGREDKFYIETVSGLITDFRGAKRLNPVFDYGIVDDLSNPTFWRAHEIDLAESYSENKLSFGRINLSVPVGERMKVRSGVSVQSFENDDRGGTTRNLLRDAFEAGTIDDDVSAITAPFNSHYKEEWVRVDVDSALRFFGVNRAAELGRLESDFTLQEESLAMYGLVEWTGGATVPFNAEFGVRLVNNQRSIVGFPLTINDVMVTEIGAEFDDLSWEVLPALNLRFRPIPDFVLRLAVSRNITYPPITALDPTTRIRTTTFIPDAIVGSTILDPYEATSVDLYADYRLRGGIVSIGYFRKSVENFVTLQAEQIAFKELGLPVELLEPGQNLDTIFSVSTYSNAQDTTLEGVELSAQVEICNWLPACEGWGGAVNVTYASGNFDYTSIVSSQVITAPFPGLSEYSANLSIFYETERLGFRSALAYRSDYITAIEPGLPEEDSRGRLGTMFLDASGYLNLTDRTQLTFDALNLTGEEELDYSDSLERLTERRESGTTVFLGVRHKF